jgi:hypothetical protein
MNRRTEEQDIVIGPEGHDDARRLVQGGRLDVPQATSLPNPNLAIGHLAEPSSRDSIEVTHPRNATAFDTAVTVRNPDRLSTSTRVEQPQLPVPAGSHQQCSSGVERDALDDIAVTNEHGFRIFRVREIPQLDCVLSGSASENVRRSRVEYDLTDLAGRRIDTRDGIEVLRDPALLPPAFKCRSLDFPNHDLAILTTRCDDGIVVGRPIRVKHGSGVASCDREIIG